MRAAHRREPEFRASLVAFGDMQCSCSKAGQVYTVLLQLQDSPYHAELMLEATVYLGALVCSTDRRAVSTQEVALRSTKPKPRR